MLQERSKAYSLANKWFRVLFPREGEFFSVLVHLKYIVQWCPMGGKYLDVVTCYVVHDRECLALRIGFTLDARESPSLFQALKILSRMIFLLLLYVYLAYQVQSAKRLRATKARKTLAETITRHSIEPERSAWHLIALSNGHESVLEIPVCNSKMFWLSWNLFVPSCTMLYVC